MNTIDSQLQSAYFRHDQVSQNDQALNKILTQYVNELSKQYNNHAENQLWEYCQLMHGRLLQPFPEIAFTEWRNVSESKIQLPRGQECEYLADNSSYFRCKTNENMTLKSTEIESISYYKYNDNNAHLDIYLKNATSGNHIFYCIGEVSFSSIIWWMIIRKCIKLTYQNEDLLLPKTNSISDNEHSLTPLLYWCQSPEQFLNFSIQLPAFVKDSGILRFHLTCYYTDIENLLTDKTIMLNVTPVANRFNYLAEPLSIYPSKNEYEIIPSYNADDKIETIDINSINFINMANESPCQLRYKTKIRGATPYLILKDNIEHEYIVQPNLLCAYPFINTTASPTSINTVVSGTKNHIEGQFIRLFSTAYIMEKPADLFTLFNILEFDYTKARSESNATFQLKTLLNTLNWRRCSLITTCIDHLDSVKIVTNKDKGLTYHIYYAASESPMSHLLEIALNKTFDTHHPINCPTQVKSHYAE